MVAYDQQTCQNLDTACTHEWLETSGIGGFASSTIIGLNTRRYHGLLTAATTPPLGRVLLRSKVEEALILDGRRFELSANQYPGVRPAVLHTLCGGCRESRQRLPSGHRLGLVDGPIHHRLSQGE